MINEREFGLQIKQQLDQRLNLNAATLSRLRAAREHALTRQRTTEACLSSPSRRASAARVRDRRSVFIPSTNVPAPCLLATMPSASSERYA